MALDGGGNLVINVYYGRPISTKQTNSSDDNLSFSYGSLNSWKLDKRIVLPKAEKGEVANFFRQCSAGPLCQ